ncbi:phosphoribosylanthranilate isomerase [Ferruginivarius sediminum]|uniref:N-(5'-phosphoribosyl)anthranilate isomerase n=1 Tax=Ferruginivarius sediminum TaxID=2661937 RepID=A0A369TBP1_9PROT|nr:phosphoribosylanthranilate isomerase [Ferruginivarius sediminum]RDD60346.1 phosphoribosylanthranilate isomerase [Ferruginivarius sediminum]
MTIETKICGINSAEAMAAVRDGGADFAGFIFYPPSPRYVTPEMARGLRDVAAGRVKTVAVVVDAADDEIARIVETAGVEMLQLHGKETPGRVAEVRKRFALPVMKSVAVAAPEDLDRAATYEEVADRLLFDAKPPKDRPDALPGGNALSFDWQLLAGRTWARPWMLSGGLNAGNLAEAVRISGARAVDVSSGVEDAPGVKNPAKIGALLRAARDLHPIA